MKQYFALIITATVFTSCTKETVQITGDSETTLSIDARAGANDFTLNTPITIDGKTYEFTNLRYWISDLRLIPESGSEYAIPDSYFLLEETNAVSVQDGSFEYPANKREEIQIKNIPAGNYKSLKFFIGVDAQHNDNLSLQSGELSQLNGMTNVSWMWHTSYIFSTLKGKVTSGTETKNFVAETGLNANYKAVNLTLATPLVVAAGKQQKLKLNLDIAKVLDGIDVFANPTIGAGQAALMTQLASNYAEKAMSITAVE